MCNNFIEDIAWKIGRRIAKCECVNLKSLCKTDTTFQLTSRDVRQLFTETEFYGAHGYDYSVMFKNFDYRKEFVDMALCYLHEGNIEKFFLLISYMSEYNYGNLNIDPSIKLYAKILFKNICFAFLLIFSISTMFMSDSANGTKEMNWNS